MELACEFRDSLWGNNEVYTCVISSASITSPGMWIKSITGEHEPGKNHLSVCGIIFNNHTVVKHIPKGIPDAFMNLSHFGVCGTGLKSISRSDFIGLENLVWVSCYDNILKTLPNNLFQGMTKLKKISFKNNLLFTIDSKLLQPIQGSLEIINLLGNPRIDEFFKKGKPCRVRNFMNTLDRINAAETRYQLLEERFDAFDKSYIQQENLIVELKIDLKQADKEVARMENRAKKSESHLKKMEEFYESKKYSDFTIVFCDKEYKVHKNILAAKSSVFDEMFTNEAQLGLKSLKKINSFSVSAFEDFLQFFYCTRVKHEENAMELLVLATEFDVHDLKATCEELIIKRLNSENAWEIYNFGHAHSSEVLRNAAFKKINREFPDIPGCLFKKPDARKYPYQEASG